MKCGKGYNIPNYINGKGTKRDVPESREQRAESREQVCSLDLVNKFNILKIKSHLAGNDFPCGDVISGQVAFCCLSICGRR